MIEAKLVGQQRFSNWSKIDVATFKWVGTDATKNRIGRYNCLDDVVSSPRSEFETTEVVRIHDIGLPILADRYSDASNAIGALEDAGIK